MTKRDRRDRRTRYRVSDIALGFDKNFIRSQSPTYINSGNRKLLLHVLRLAIEEELTGLQREYAMRYYFDEMTMQEIAEQCGVNQSTVSRTLKRARAKLQHALKYCMYVLVHMNDEESEEGGIWANAY